MIMWRALWIFLLVFFYAHLYVHFIVNPNNECSILEEITKEDITNKVYAKLPFVFNGEGMTSGSLLEPYVRFDTTRTFYEKKKWTETHESCRTFYHIHKGCYEVACIHPKYKEQVPHKKILKQNSKILRLTLHEHSVLFVPTYWIVQFKETTPGKVEKITYKTPMNHLAISIGKIFE